MATKRPVEYQPEKALPHGCVGLVPEHLGQRIAAKWDHVSPDSGKMVYDQHEGDWIMIRVQALGQGVHDVSV